MNKIVSLCAVLALLMASIPLTVFAQVDEGATEGGSRTIYLPIIAQNSQAEAVTDAAIQGDLYAVPNVGSNSDNAPHPLGDRQSARKRKALPAKLNGKAKGKTHQVARGQYVELAREGQELIWTVLGEFGTQINPTYGGTVGPLHNQIAQPDRSTDNLTIWQPDFHRAYYETLLFNPTPDAISLRNYYLEQSANRYTVSGDVTDWVQVPYNEANYGSNYCGYFFCARTWLFVRDSVEAWYNTQLAAGKSSAAINAYLSKFDVWDRYDYDGDGNFNEPDGYIDHFQSIHAGEGEEYDNVAQGADAIWSHRWYAFYNLSGVTGPSFNKQGGVRVGNSDYWVGDYTIEPENGGVGIFAHEFGHDLGLPDLYDISMNTGGADNSVGYWSLYDLGNYGSGDGADNFPGAKPISMSAYEKIFLGWSNNQVVRYGQSAAVKLGPASANTKQAQQLIVLLPDKQVDASVGSPQAGSYFYHSGAGNNLDNTMTRQVTLPAGAVHLTAKVRYDIELDWDYAYLTVNGNPVVTNLSANSNPNNQNFGNGITGSSNGAWVDLSADLSAYAGQTVALGFRYWTDVSVVLDGFAVDEIVITGAATDGAETEPGWSYSGFVRTNGVISKSFFNAYYAEFRNYRGYDDALRTGPVMYPFYPENPRWVEHFPYQDGLLVWYYDTSFADNNVADHCAAGRCGGMFLPVDAHPNLMIHPSGVVWVARLQSYDSTFGLEPTDPLCLHWYKAEQCNGSLPANPLFDDTQRYWFPPDPAINHRGYASVEVPHTGTTIRVVSVSAQGDFMQVKVAPKR